jgi:hypothetical protein
MNRRFAAVMSLAAASFAGCGAGGAGSGSNTGTVPTPTASLSLSAATLNINASGATQKLSATETGYSGAFTAALSGCGGIATVDAATQNGPQGTFTFTAAGPGSCAVTISDDHGQTQQATIVVTTTSGTLQ